LLGLTKSEGKKLPGNRFDDAINAPLWTLLPLAKVRSINLANNRLVGANVDLSFGTFPSLVDLNVSQNMLSGALTVGERTTSMGILDVSLNQWACFLPQFPTGMRIKATCSLFQSPSPLVLDCVFEF
jgi:hypothetical protein